MNQSGADFLKLVPTTWDDIHFIDGYPGDFVAIAKRSGTEWFIGVMNNSREKEIEIKLDFISDADHEIKIWADAKDANKEPKNLKISSRRVKSGDVIKIKLANNGGWVARITTL